MMITNASLARPLAVTSEAFDQLKNQKYLTKISAIVTCVTALVFLPIFGYYAQPWLMYFYVPLLLVASLPLLPAMQSRPNLSRMVLFVSTNGLAVVTAIHFGEESHINIAALVALCHTLMVTRLREYALLGFGIGLTTCTLLVYHIIPNGLLIPIDQYPKFGTHLGAVVEFAAVLIVGIQIVILRMRLSDRTQKLRESSDALQDQVLQLSHANKELFAAKEAHSTLVRILCHDLATPVSTAEICLSRPAVTEREVEILRRSIRKVKETISDVRDLERLHTSKAAIALAKEALIPLLLELKDSFSSELQAKEIDLVVKEADVSAFCLVDRSIAANQVFANVLRNAIKFSKRASRIEVSVHSSETNVAVHFRDFGVGIPKELIAKLFDPHQRTSRPGTEKESGTGFGMPIIKACMEEMEGSVTVQSWTDQDLAGDLNDPESPARGTLVTLSFKAALHN